MNPGLANFVKGLKTQYGSIDHPDAQTMIMTSAVISFIADPGSADHFKEDLFKAFCSFLTARGKMKAIETLVKMVADNDGELPPMDVANLIRDIDDAGREKWQVMRNILEIGDSERKDDDK